MPSSVNDRLIAGTCTALLAAALCAQVSAAKISKIDPATGEGAMTILRKIQCSTRDGEPVIYWWTGDMYSRVPGERDKLLFKVDGMNIRQCDTVHDPVRGAGYRYVSREIMLYEDPVTRVVAHTWKNPWTGDEVPVIQVANDPVNARGPTYALDKDGKPLKWNGLMFKNNWWTTDTVPLFYDNPLQGSYQEYVGGKYHAVEMFNSFGNVDDLLSEKTATAQVKIGWVRIAGWLPWMKMGDRAGELYFHAAGQKIAQWSDLPDVLKSEIENTYPAWKSPPPVDDTRPNETSWTYFKKQVTPPAPPSH
jgi:hypothetical protein